MDNENPQVEDKQYTQNKLITLLMVWETLNKRSMLI